MIKKGFFILFLLFIFLSVNTFATATDVNSSDDGDLSIENLNETVEITDFKEVNLESNLNIEDISTNDSQESPDNNTNITKNASKISIKSGKIKSDDILYIYLMDFQNNPVKLKGIVAKINNKNYNLITDLNGVASLKLKLPAKKYTLAVSFKEDDDYNSSSATFNIIVSKLKSKLKSSSVFIINGKYVYAYLYDAYGKAIPSKNVYLKVHGKTYEKKTDKNGRVAFRLKFSPSYYKSTIKFKGDKYYTASSKKLNFYLVKSTSLKIGNDKLLTNGYLRIYLRDLPKTLLCKKTIKITVGLKNFTKKTDSEGIIILKPKLGTDKYTVTAQFKNLNVTKKVQGVKGSGLRLLEDRIPSKNGEPDIDYLSKNYVMGDENAKYTLTKAQYQKVLKRDSECLYYYKKLTNYAFFATKDNPTLQHIVTREKWNVIEKEINKKIVNSNWYNYLPKEITVSLKGKSYVYPEVRDPQNTEYTCGPTSASVCSQVLKHYYSERYFAKKMGTNHYGTGTGSMSYVLNNHGFSCSYFFKTSYYHGIKELKKGGCALIFHTKNHYVAVIDISKDGKKVLVSNSYGNWYNIPTNWMSVKYLKTRFYKNYDDSLIVRLNYHLSDKTKFYLHNYYYNMGPNWDRCNVCETI